MGWSEKKANERVENNDFSSDEIEVLDLSREMDFENLGPKDVRRGKGVHMYVDVPNFNKVIAEVKNDSEKQKRIIQAASVLRKAQLELLKQKDVTDIQLQAVRLHSFCHKPYDEETKRAENSVLTAITMNSYIVDVFNDVFKSVADFHCSVGMASGETLITNIGANGNRELISLGTPANLGAKILGKNGSIRITEAVYKALPSDLAALFSKLEDQKYPEKVYEAQDITWSKHPKLAESYDIKFNIEKWTEKTKAYREDLPLKDIELSDASVLIDIESLTETNSKKVDSVVLFADLDGFTALVQGAESNDEVADLVRQLHLIRTEFHAVVTQDFNGLPLQHRGDCLLALVHLPSGDDSASKRAEDAAKIALGLQSSMEHVLSKYMGDNSGIHVAVGVDEGGCIVSRLGKKGQREVVCFGVPVENAESLQKKTNGQDVRISASIYGLLPECELKNQFSKDGTSYLMKSMTFPRLAEIEAQKAAQKGQLNVSADRGLFVANKTSEAPKPHMVVNPWLSK